MIFYGSKFDDKILTIEKQERLARHHLNVRLRNHTVFPFFLGERLFNHFIMLLLKCMNLELKILAPALILCQLLLHKLLRLLY